MSAALIGVIALQGAFAKHQVVVEALEVRVRLVKTVDDITGLTGLIIPGGESTVISKLLKRSGLDIAITEAVTAGLPVFGTCAGLILLAKEIEGTQLSQLKLLDISVKRNGYGRQRNSFRRRLFFENSEIEGVFIRAPRIQRMAPKVEILCCMQEEAVLVKQDNILASTFHPELGGDLNVHKYFIKEMC